MTKAMKPSATWVMMDRLSTCSRVPKPMPKLLRPSRPFLLFLSQARFLAACQKPKKHSTVINYTIPLSKKQHPFRRQN
jgi:hypothetical protein